MANTNDSFQEGDIPTNHTQAGLALDELESRMQQWLQHEEAIPAGVTLFTYTGGLMLAQRAVGDHLAAAVNHVCSQGTVLYMIEIRRAAVLVNQETGEHRPLKAGDIPSPSEELQRLMAMDLRTPQIQLTRYYAPKGGKGAGLHPVATEEAARALVDGSGTFVPYPHQPAATGETLQQIKAFVASLAAQSPEILARPTTH